MSLRVYRCPKCNHEQKALGGVVQHRCPSNQSRWTEYKIVEQEPEE